MSSLKTSCCRKMGPGKPVISGVVITPLLQVGVITPKYPFQRPFYRGYIVTPFIFSWGPILYIVWAFWFIGRIWETHLVHTIGDRIIGVGEFAVSMVKF